MSADKMMIALRMVRISSFPFAGVVRAGLRCKGLLGQFRKARCNKLLLRQAG